MSAASRPFYFRMLRLRHLHPSPAITFLLFEGSAGLGLLLALAEVISWWGAIAIPICVALMVKLNDIVATALIRPFALTQLATPRLADTKAVGRSAIPRASARSETTGRGAGRGTGRPGQKRGRSTARGVATVRPEPTARKGPHSPGPNGITSGSVTPSDGRSGSGTTPSDSTPSSVTPSDGTFGNVAPRDRSGDIFDPDRSDAATDRGRLDQRNRGNQGRFAAS